MRHLLFFFTLVFVIILSFSLVQGATPGLVQNVASMSEPYATGINDSGISEGRPSDAEVDASYDLSEGITNALAGSFPSNNNRVSSAWAEAYLGDTFEIVHSSDYRITFSFDYKGMISITNPALVLGNDAHANIFLSTSLIETNDGSTINQKTETIFPTGPITGDIDSELTGSSDIVLTVHLEATHIYEWKAGLRVETYAEYGLLGAEASADFFDNGPGYRAKITQVLIEDLNPDNIVPTTVSSLTGTLGENGWYTTTVSIALDATDLPSDGYGVDYINQRINDEPWSRYTLPFIISSDGATKVDFYSVDKAANEESPKTITVKIDGNAPTGEVAINNGAQYTITTLVTLLAQASDGQGSGVYQMRFHNDGESWGTWMNYRSTEVPWTLLSGDGTKRVYVQFKDNAGNLSPIYYDEITLDTEPPSGTIMINENAQYTTSRSVTLQISYSDDLDIRNVRYSNDGIWDTERWETPSKTKDWNLLPEDGTKTVYAQFRDNSGLKSSVIFDSIILDTTPPTGYIEINGNETETSSTLVTLTPTADDANGVAQVCFSNDNVNWSAWESLGEKTWTLTDGIGEKTVYAQFKDNAGLNSSTCTDIISLVSPPPSPTPSPSPKSSPTPSPTPSPSSERSDIIVYAKDLSNNPVEGATVTSISQPNGQSSLMGTTDPSGTVTFNNVVAGSYIFHASKSSLSGNSAQITAKSQEETSVTIVIEEDVTEPTISVTLNPENPGDSQQWLFTVTADDNIAGTGLSKITLYIDETPVETWTSAGTHTYSASFPPQSAHSYYVEAFDNANNKARNPPLNNWEFSVPAQSPTDSTELWKILGVIIIIANGTALIFISTRGKRGKNKKKSEPDDFSF
jgi:hypothetical protein